MDSAARRRWLAPEVIQTSMMDCGPASLKCLLEGWGIPASYGRLREACQTDVDGTSIDVLETVAGQLGLDAEQVMLPVDHLRHDETLLPALIVTRRTDGPAHFVVIWRRVGPWFQVMDPAVGRRWVRCDTFLDELYRHRLSVSADDWSEWARTEAFLGTLRRRCIALGASGTKTEAWVGTALADLGWRSLANLDAAVRMSASLMRSRALSPGRTAVGFVDALLARSGREVGNEIEGVAAHYRSVRSLPDDGGDSDDDEQVLLDGAVLIRIRGRRDDSLSTDNRVDAGTESISFDLQAALREKPPRPFRTLLRMLCADGLLSPLFLLGAALIAVAAVFVESLLFRGFLDISRDLALSQQRLAAVAGLLVFLALILAIEIPIAVETLRMGRHLELRLRMALLRKLPLLGDRYLQSRPISDMAERSHGVHLTRTVPDLGVRFVRALFELLFTLAAIALIAPASAPLALAIAALVLGIPMSAQPALNERDLRVRTHSAALLGFYLDSLVGLVAVRTHGAEIAVRREHESRLVEWVRSSRSLIGISVRVQALQAASCLGLGAWLLWDHLQRQGATGSVLLLAFWTLKLPAAGKQIASLARQYPAERNTLLRLLEPLESPEETEGTADREIPDSAFDSASAANPSLDQPRASSREPSAGTAISIHGGKVVAAGHTILADIDLEIGPGEHVAIVGPSGAGKSSLLGLLLGWHRLAEGTFAIDGLPFSGRRLQALRKTTAWVDPAIQIWNRPFLENLCYSAGEESVESTGRVLETADLMGIVQKLPKGMQSPLGEGGARLSGGEGQRVRLGRALMQDRARLVLCDEPFRGLDRSQRRILLQRVRESWRDSTLLCVTHDVAETLAFDRVLVVENGQIAEDGRPSRLAAADSRYRELLRTEEQVRRNHWEADFWRRLRVEKGTLSEMLTGEKQREPRPYRRARLARG